MANSKVQAALNISNEVVDSSLDEIASEILDELDEYFHGLWKVFVKKLIMRVRDRFERDGINLDDAAFGYIVRKLLHDFGALDDSHHVLPNLLSGEKRQRADLIVYDIQSALNSKIGRIFIKRRCPADFAKSFEKKLIEAGLEITQATALAKVLWEEVQHRIGL